ncbi:cation:proton antiporter [Lactococcus formosensis]|uniref:Cation:proton antiporter n=1 Tax=Lactococcus formosensis TaxID=1281486 RepID=A0A9X4P9B7_9LACT|nr:cation:proton antiporter [Lactococcus formosensis]MCO7180922.1 cation:proton antiporter [Lactococcus formosensis]MDG6119884.1 cation:proton antiporter [Lactococcus formosensis]MDG6126896.1 cation:proton antiporter [Lactococcus formosensis]MDG6143431.1 cation:proton antiporter [Lactococcus formosensis]MDG6160160.1 cation:proton antiporter [Lactococcus formosensis]
MSAVSFIAVMLIGVIVANVIKEFFPKISETFILIGVGIILSFLPEFRHFELEPEFFMMLIIAPLMFNEGSKTSLKEVRKNFRGIFFLSITLAVVTVLFVAALTTNIMGSWIFPLAICFAAIVTPTDSVAVKSIIAGKKMPQGVNEAVEFESLFNDASGLVLLSLGLSVLESGHFSIWSGLGQFAFVSIGGILIGLIVGTFLVRIRIAINLRATNPEATIIPISILTPFALYLLAEHFGTSGVLAVVAAGLIHNFEGDMLKLTSTNVQLTNNTIWEILSGILNNFVFILLGVSLFGIWDIFKSLGFKEAVTLFFISALVYLLMLFIRKFWTNQRGNRSIEHFFSNDKKERSKDSSIFALSGAHGTMTLAMAFSLPLDTAILSTENREIIISMATIVILLSLIVPTFILPKFLSPMKEASLDDIDSVRNDMVDYAILHMMQVVEDSKVRSSLTKQLQSQKGLQIPDHNKSSQLLEKTVTWQETLLESSDIQENFSPKAIDYFQIYLENSSKRAMSKKIRRLFSRRRQLRRADQSEMQEFMALRNDLGRLEDILYEATMEKLNRLERERFEKKITDFSDIEEVRRVFENRHYRIRNEIQEETIVPNELLIEAFQLEYQYVLDQAKSEAISKETSNKLFKEINNAQVLQLQNQ